MECGLYEIWRGRDTLWRGERRLIRLTSVFSASRWKTSIVYGYRLHQLDVLRCEECMHKLRSRCFAFYSSSPWRRLLSAVRVTTCHRSTTHVTFPRKLKTSYFFSQCQSRKPPVAALWSFCASLTRVTPSSNVSFRLTCFGQ